MGGRPEEGLGPYLTFNGLTDSWGEILNALNAALAHCREDFSGTELETIDGADLRGRGSGPSRPKSDAENELHLGRVQVRPPDLDREKSGSTRLVALHRLASATAIGRSREGWSVVRGLLLTQEALQHEELGRRARAAGLVGLFLRRALP
jgi:hypothetical protein